MSNHLGSQELTSASSNIGDAGSFLNEVDSGALLREIQALRSHVQNVERSLLQLKADLYNPRVRIQNLEGTFKTLSATPTSDDTNYQDGTLILTDVSGARRIYVRIAGSWYSVAVT